MPNKTLKVSVEFNHLVLNYPSIERGMLTHIGYQVKDLMYQQFFRGQLINLLKKKDIKGRRTYRYIVTKKGNSVKISSYVMNLFERGRTLRSGRKEPGKRLFQDKLPKLADAKAQEAGSRYMDNLVKEVNREQN